MYPQSRRLISKADLLESLGLCLFKILSEIDFHASSDYVLIGGSLVEGFGNRLSDIDVLVIGRKQSRPTTIFHSETLQRWVDVTYLSLPTLQAYMHSLPNLNIDHSQWGNCRPAPFEALEMIHDVCYGVVISEPWIGEPLPRNDHTVNLLRRSWALSNIIAARARWQDAVGALQDGQNSQAKYMRDICIGHCIDAYTSLLGETDINVKWRFAKLARVRSSGKDVINLSGFLFDHTSLDNLSWNDAAQLLFDVICLFVKGCLYDPPYSPLQEGGRFEIDSGRWVYINVEGVSQVMAAPNLRTL
ncbi:hypothetical protein [Pseudomonas sp. PGPR40]|uniref:hypothetical protein n=1 Tax=Pseudomonas sp. PGPR40 TaxID=2913476 RepID=UPI001EDB378F|nr:hypothetical protein [Pseudomonas sp. PGPR40]